MGRSVEARDLLSVQETETLRERVKALSHTPTWRCEMGFADKSSARFQTFVHALAQLNPSPVYVWTPLSNVCGLLRPVPLSDVDFGFEFSLNPDGILVILTADLLDKLLLDYSTGAAGEQLLEVEVSGAHWAQARY